MVGIPQKERQKMKIAIRYNHALSHRNQNEGNSYSDDFDGGWSWCWGFKFENMESYWTTGEHWSVWASDFAAARLWNSLETVVGRNPVGGLHGQRQVGGANEKSHFGDQSVPIAVVVQEWQVFGHWAGVY